MQGMWPTLNRSSAIPYFECSNGIKIWDRIMFNSFSTVIILLWVIFDRYIIRNSMYQLQLAVYVRWQLTPFPEQTCPLLPVGQERVVSWETGMHCWLRHTMLFPHLVPSCTRPRLMVSPPGCVVKELWAEKRAVFFCAVCARSTTTTSQYLTSWLSAIFHPERDFSGHAGISDLLAWLIPWPFWVVWEPNQAGL